MTTISTWITASRPKTLIIGMSPVLIGSTLALSTGSFKGLMFLFTLLTALGIQIVANFANDYFDCIKGADSSTRKGPLRVMQAGLVRPQTMKRAIIITCCLTALAGCLLVWQGGIGIACLLALSLMLALLYTAGPYPLAYYGWGDLFAFTFFGPIAVAGTYFLHTHVWSSEAFLAGISPGAFAMAVLVVNNVRDIEEDRLANKKTLPVRWGKTFGKIHYIVSLIIAWVPVVFFSSTRPFTLLTLLVLIPLTPLMITMLKRNVEPKTYNQMLAQTGKLLGLFTLLFCMGWML